MRVGGPGDQRRQTATDLQQEVETEESARGGDRRDLILPLDWGKGGQREEDAFEKPHLARPAGGPAHPADPQLLTAPGHPGPLGPHSPFRHVRGRARAPGAGSGGAGGPGWAGVGLWWCFG